ncbi:Gfo/Idh/MocA family protein [Sphingobacterium puteale]|uniref:Gfo/Idh/MocA family protein n=1 Tax=Sphingobacterium puteale TaxID=2420510 RepID=UPI003D971D5E
MKVLIVGLGSIAQKHISAIRELDSGIELYAFRRSRLNDSVENINNIYSLEDNSVSFDFAIVSNPTANHADTIRQLKILRVPLFIEKPLFERLGYLDLIREINREKIETYVACNLRFLDSLKFLKQFLNERIINEVNVYCGSFLPDWRPNIDFRSVYSANKEQGGGVHIDLIHEVDYLVWLFGFPLEDRKTFLSNSSLNISAYDYANYLFIYEKFAANVILNYYRRDAKRSIEVICADDTILVDLLKNSVSLNGKIVFDSPQLIRDTYIEQMRFFIDKVKNGNNIDFNNINEAYKILKLCLED